MLTHLKIQNYALIRELDISFGNGFNTITGETGTGKSIMLGALGLILGQRADTSVLFDQDRKCVVEGRFHIEPYKLQKFFTDNDLDWEPYSIIRREINSSGKSRAFINDTPVTLPVLKELGEQLVDIHSQHQTLKLLAPQFQLSLLDSVAGNKTLLDEYTQGWNKWKRDSRKLAELKEKAAQSKKEYDFNLFQLNEIQEAQLKPGEVAELEEELSLLSNAEDIRLKLEQAGYYLEGDENGINNRLTEIKKQLSSISSFNPALEQFYQRLNSALLEMQDLHQEMENFRDEIQLDNERMEFVEARMQTINHLLHKHQYSTTDELLTYADELQSSIDAVENQDEEITAIEKQLAADRSKLERLAGQLSASREQQVQPLQQRLQELLQQLGIPEARVVIQLKKLPELNESGQDEMAILFSANKGAQPAPVAQAASGGELSRIMLCLKYILAESILLPTLIFDEIDTGISGEVSIKVGQMISRMAGRHQIMAITHQPQIAAMGMHHYIVYKVSGEEMTTTHIRQLQADERIGEIAKMIAGHNPSTLAVENARELLASYK